MNNQVTFWEKPGCIGNQQQKALLRKQGWQLDVRDLLTTSWTAEELRPFFADKAVPEWFNQSAPDVKSGIINIQQLSEREALALMLENPLLICRPLLQFGALKQSGFVPGVVLDSLHIKLQDGQDLQSCPMSDSAEVCETPT
jgi:nitrogenase-associated protein